MSLSTSPSMKILSGMDEAGATATRTNSGALGSSYDFTPRTASAQPGEGVPTVSDGLSGRAARVGQDAADTTEYRLLYSKQGSFESRDDRPALPISAAGDDFAFGARFKWVSGYTETSGGDDDFQVLWGMTRVANSQIPKLAIGFQAADDATPASGAQLVLWAPGAFASGLNVDAAGDWTATGSPSTNYIEQDEWYRVVVRIYYDGSSGWLVKVYLVKESDGTIYTWTYSGTAETTDWTDDAGNTDYAWTAGFSNDGTGAGTYTTPYAYLDEVWFYDAALSDSDAQDTAVSGLTIPWVEPDYHREAHELYSACTKENADYPKTRALPSGCTVARHPVDVLCQEIRCRIEGWKAGQPWSHRAVDFIFDPAGPYGSHRARQGERPDLSIGVWREPGRKPWGACEDARNVDFTRAGPRRRRGFKIRRDVDSTAPTGHNSFFTFRSYADELFRGYKVGTALYEDTGEAASSLSTGWNASQVPVTFFLDDRLAILTGNKRVLWPGGSTVHEFGADAPASISAAAASGGTLNGTYVYAATLYDPTTGDETAPVVDSSSVSPSTQKVTLTLPASAPESRFTKYRIYRTVDGGSAPNLFLIDTVNVASSYDDTGEVDGTRLVPQVQDSDGNLLAYLTMTAPDTFAIGISHGERAIYAQGGTFPERIWISEANEPIKWYDDPNSDTGQWITADGPVRALASWQGRVLVFTDSTVEIVESDFVRDADGNLNISRTVISRSVGALGQHAVVTFQGNVFWMDRRGVYTLQGTEAVPVSGRIEDLFPYINTNLGEQVVGAWNHMRNYLVWTLPNAELQDDSSLIQTQFVMPLQDPEKWWFYDLEATFIGQFDDDLNGQRWGCIDHAGIFKELESYEGDGQEGNESGTFESQTGISSISEDTINVSGSPGWTTDEHRGKGLILRDDSTGLLYYYTIRGNGSASLTVDRTVNAALGASDGYYIGGMNAFAQYAGHDFGSSNRKVVRQVQHTFADLTREELFL